MPTFKFCLCVRNLTALFTLGFLCFACVRQLRSPYLSNTIIPIKSGCGLASWMPWPLTLFSPLLRTCHESPCSLNKPAFQTEAKPFHLCQQLNFVCHRRWFIQHVDFFLYMEATLKFQAPEGVTQNKFHTHNPTFEHQNIKFGPPGDLAPRICESLVHNFLFLAFIHPPPRPNKFRYSTSITSKQFTF